MVPLLASYRGLDGFLGTRGSFMLDLVFVAMLAVIPVLAWSIYQVRFRRRYRLHKITQLTLGGILLVTVLAFEIDMRINGWTDRAEPSPYWRPGGWNDLVDLTLGVHLFFAIPTLFLWGFVIIQALRHFPAPPVPGRYSRRHIFWGRLAAFEMTMTALTGWLFYWVAFGAG